MSLGNITLFVCALLPILSTALAQDRMPPIPADRLTDAQKQAQKELMAGKRAATGLTGPFIPMVRSPEFMTRAQKMGEYLRFESVLGSRLNEFVILITAREWTQQYEWNAHQPLALKAGLKQDIITAVAEGRRPAAMAEDEAIVYDFCMELHRKKSVSDDTYARAVKKFGEQGVIDMLGVSGYYSMLGMIMNVARTPLEDPKAPLPLAAFPR